MVIAIIVDNELDQFVETQEQANAEMKDLREMGYHRVKTKRFDSWLDADAWEDRRRGW